MKDRERGEGLLDRGKILFWEETNILANGMIQGSMDVIRLQ